MPADLLLIAAIPPAVLATTEICERAVRHQAAADPKSRRKRRLFFAVTVFFILFSFGTQEQPINHWQPPKQYGKCFGNSASSRPWGVRISGPDLCIAASPAKMKDAAKVWRLACSRSPPAPNVAASGHPGPASGQAPLSRHARAKACRVHLTARHKVTL